MNHHLSDKAVERLNYVYDLIRRYQPVLDSYDAHGGVTQETLAMYNDYLKEYHAILHGAPGVTGRKFTVRCK